MTSEENKRVYARYVELLNAQDFGALPEVVDPERYREICVGFTPGWVELPEAVTSLRKVLGGIPDLNARIDDLAAEGDKVYARLTVTGTNSGRFFGVPPTGRSYEVNMFDYARLEDGRIVERVQQSDTLSQLGQMYGGGCQEGRGRVGRRPPRRHPVRPERRMVGACGPPEGPCLGREGCARSVRQCGGGLVHGGFHLDHAARPLPALRPDRRRRLRRLRGSPQPTFLPRGRSRGDRYGCERRAAALFPATARPSWAVLLGIALIAVIAVSTALFQAPQHQILSGGFDRGAYEYLLRTNWIRTAAWSAYALLGL